MRDRYAALPALLAAMAMALSACSDDGRAAARREARRAARAAALTECPLTGLDPAEGVDLGRPAVGIKVENDPAARPLAGLERADVVVEERVEGGITRFLTIFHCSGSPKVGSVRSGRFDDPKIVKPFTRLLAASGSNAIVEREMATQNIAVVDERTAPGGALFRDPPGSGDVHSLFANSEKLRALAVKRKIPPPTPGIFEFGELTTKPRKARSVSINFVDGNTIEYRWGGEAWMRFEGGEPFMAASGKQIATPNLLIQLVRVDNSKTIFDVAHNPSPDIHLENSKGKALLFRDGKVVRGTWQLGKAGSPPVYRTARGAPMVFAPGRIWIELVPNKLGEVKGSVALK